MNCFFLSLTYMCVNLYYRGWFSFSFFGYHGVIPLQTACVCLSSFYLYMFSLFFCFFLALWFLLYINRKKWLAASLVSRRRY